MYDISFDDSVSSLFPGQIKLSLVHEGENRIHGFSVYNITEGLNHVWPIFKFPSGGTKIGEEIVLENDDDQFDVDFPDCLLTEHGRLSVQIVATDSSKNILEIFDEYAAGTFDGTIQKSRVYEFYVNESLDALQEMAAASGGISQAVKDYIEKITGDPIRFQDIRSTNPAYIDEEDYGGDPDNKKGKIAYVDEAAVFHCNQTDSQRTFLDPPTNNAYTIVNTQRSTNYNLQFAFGTTEPYFYWRIIDRRTHLPNIENGNNGWQTVSGSGSSVAIDPTLSVAGAAADAAAVGQALSEKADKNNAWFADDVRVGGSDYDSGTPLAKATSVDLYGVTHPGRAASTTTDILYDVAGTASQALECDFFTDLPEASDLFQSVLSDDLDIFCFGAYGARNVKTVKELREGMSTDPDDEGFTDIGYWILVNAERWTSTGTFRAQFKRIDSTKPAYILSVLYDGTVQLFTTNLTGLMALAYKAYGTTAVKEELADVAFTGDYDDLKNKPSFPTSGSANIPTGTLDSTSTSTVMTAQVSGITELKDGVCMWLRNNVVTSAQNFTLNINNLGAKPVYASNANATRVSGGYVNGFTVLFIYNSTRVTGGCWDYVYGFDSNTTYTPATLGFCYVNVASATPPAYIGTNASYVPVNGGIVCINAMNDIDANATLNISNKGASPIYYRGSAITSGVVKSGDVATLVYYNNRYYLLSVDRWGLEEPTAFHELARISSMSNVASDVNGFIGGASVYVHSADPGSYVASKIIATQQEFGDIYLNNANQPLQRGVIDNDGEKTFILACNLKTTETDAESGFDIDDATKPAYLILLSEDSEEDSGYNLSCVSTGSLAGQTWVIGYPDEETTRSYVESAIQAAIGTAIGGSY